MKVKICKGKSCSEKFSSYIIQRCERDKKFFKQDNIEIIESPCMGLCENSPNIEVDGVIYSKQNPSSVSKIIFKNNKDA